MKITKDQLRAWVTAKSKPDNLHGGHWVDPVAEQTEPKEVA